MSDGVDGAVAGDDAHVVVRQRQVGGDVRAVGSERAADRPEHVLREGNLVQPVDEQTSLAWRRQQHDAPECGGRVFGQVPADHQPAERMPHEMDSGGVEATAPDRSRNGLDLFGERIRQRFVADGRDVVAGPLQPHGQQRHRTRPAPQAMHEHHRFRLSGTRGRVTGRSRRQQQREQQPDLLHDTIPARSPGLPHTLPYTPVAATGSRPLGLHSSRTSLNTRARFPPSSRSRSEELRPRSSRASRTLSRSAGSDKPCGKVYGGSGSGSCA